MKEVCVDREERGVLTNVNQLRYRPVSRAPAEFTCCEEQGDAESSVLRYHRCKRDTVDLHAENDYEQQIQRNIGQVDREEDQQGYAGVLESEEPADHHEVRQCARRAPYAYVEIFEGVGLEIPVGAKQIHRELADWPLQYHHGRRDQEGDDDGLTE